MENVQGLQERMVALIRAFGLHRPDVTPCGQPISVSEAHALMELAGGDPLSQNDLTRRLRLEKSTVSRLVVGMEKRGWLKRDRVPGDGRRVRLLLTGEGRRNMERLADARADKFARLLDRIPPGERAVVFQALDMLVKAMREEEKE